MNVFGLKRFLLVLVILITACSPRAENVAHVPETPFIQEIEWQAYDPAIFAENKDMPALLYFESEGCHACQTMNETTLENDAIKHFIMKNFLPILINEEDDEEFFYFLVNKYEVRSTPGFVVLSQPSYNRILSKREGLVDAKFFIIFLKISKDMDTALSLHATSDAIIKLFEGLNIKGLEIWKDTKE